ncbi:Uncharacterised protein [uncultured archaeon]|nr:Uncharacterised protein [uncultured archaeon]
MTDFIKLVKGIIVALIDSVIGAAIVTGSNLNLTTKIILSLVDIVAFVGIIFKLLRS